MMNSEDVIVVAVGLIMSGIVSFSKVKCCWEHDQNRKSRCQCMRCVVWMCDASYDFHFAIALAYLAFLFAACSTTRHAMLRLLAAMTDGDRVGSVCVYVCEVY